MRVAAGVLIIIVGLTLPALYQGALESFAKTMGVNAFDIMERSPGLALLPLVLLLGLVASGVCAFNRKYWWLALSGAICAVFIGFAVIPFIFAPMGILAVIFLVKRKGEFERKSTQLKAPPGH